MRGLLPLLLLPLLLWLMLATLRRGCGQLSWLFLPLAVIPC
jgi:hypothetical protein